MKNSIQHFVENGIPELEKIRINFMKAPSLFDECAEEVKKIFLKTACMLLSEWLEEGNTLLEESLKRRMSWQIKDRCVKKILTPSGTVSFTHTRFKNKKTGKTAYLLDRIMGWEPHARISFGLKAALLEGAAQGSCEKAGEAACEGDERVGKETVMRCVHSTKAPFRTGQEGEKRKVQYLYVEADEDHAALQFHEKKGDIKRHKGHADNGQIIKLVYVHEGYAEEGEKEGKRRKLKNTVYFGGIYSGKENAVLWGEVKRYIEKQYRTEEIEKIYFQSDGGAWMKKGMEILGAEFVLDEFHLWKYMRRMARICGETEESREEILKMLRKWAEEGKRRKLEEWTEGRKGELEERERKKLEESWKYLKNNWKGIGRRVQGGDGIMGSSTESHVSHILSSRMSSRPMGWSREGADRLSRLRIYWKNGGGMLELVRSGKKADAEEAAEKEEFLSAADLLSWERKHRRNNGKYIEALQKRVSRQTSVKVHFNAGIAGVC